jgi:uncharacterized membrane protein YozB (DUF420 family)
MNTQGFLGRHAPLGSDLSLLVTVASAVLFAVGWRLAVSRRFEAHRWVMSTAAVLNLIPVVAWMIRYSVLYSMPELPARLGQSPYALTTAHAAIRTVGVVLGVFVVLRGNELVPRALRFSNYKAFMRLAYALYMIGTLLGVLVYLELYGDL